MHSNYLQMIQMLEQAILEPCRAWVAAELGSVQNFQRCSRWTTQLPPSAGGRVSSLAFMTLEPACLHPCLQSLLHYAAQSRWGTIEGLGRSLALTSQGLSHWCFCH